MNHFLRYLWFIFIIRPLVLLIVGVNIRHREKLVSSQPAIIVANHNSHLDTMVLMSLFPLKLLKKTRPVAAVDYFLRSRLLSWFALKIIGVVPINRDTRKSKEDPLAGCSQALEQGEVLIFFPEGTRGEPEEIKSFKRGIAHLSRRCPKVPVIPVFLYGLGKVLPRGEGILVPFFCDVVVGDPLFWTGSQDEFMDKLENTMKTLASQVNVSPWE